jgi:hypothetical protein
MKAPIAPRLHLIRDPASPRMPQTPVARLKWEPLARQLLRSWRGGKREADGEADDTALIARLGCCLERIRTRRRASVRSAARYAGLTTSAWRDLEQGEIHCSVATLLRAVNVLGISLADLAAEMACESPATPAHPRPRLRLVPSQSTHPPRPGTPRTSH